MTETIKRGKFVVVEGGPGAGKTSFLIKFKQEYPFDNWRISREPGGTPYGEDVRDAVQSIRNVDISPTATLLGYQSSRANLVELVIKPALESGNNFILDRYWFSTWAYQGAMGVSKVDILASSFISTHGLLPDLTLFFKIDPALGQARKHGRADVDRFDMGSEHFFNRVMKGYKQLGTVLWPRWKTVDASKSKDEVFAEVTDIMRSRNLIK